MNGSHKVGMLYVWTCPFQGDTGDLDFDVVIFLASPLLALLGPGEDHSHYLDLC